LVDFNGVPPHVQEEILKAAFVNTGGGSIAAINEYCERWLDTLRKVALLEALDGVQHRGNATKLSHVHK
jgi:hypothetical protein